MNVSKSIRRRECKIKLNETDSKCRGREDRRVCFGEKERGERGREGEREREREREN